MVSNELLSAVLDVDSDWFIDDITIRDSLVIIDYGQYDGNFDKDVFNIYELAHKCKEWANGNGADITSTNRQGIYSNKALALVDVDWRPDEREIVEATTEPEAIFKACEWILQQTNQKEPTSHQNNNS